MSAQLPHDRPHSQKSAKDSSGRSALRSSLVAAWCVRGASTSPRMKLLRIERNFAEEVVSHFSSIVASSSEHRAVRSLHSHHRPPQRMSLASTSENIPKYTIHFQRHTRTRHVALLLLIAYRCETCTRVTSPWHSALQWWYTDESFAPSLTAPLMFTAKCALFFRLGCICCVELQT